jgi:monoamine oxidase
MPCSRPHTAASSASRRTSSPRYRARDGNDVFAERLAAELDDRVETDQRLIAVRRAGDGFTLTFENQRRTGSQLAATRVVFAVPFSVLRHVNLDGAGLSDAKRDVIATLGYGTNTKLVGAFATRSWRAQRMSGSVTSDLPFQQVWDSSTGQSGDRGALTNLLGGNAGLDANAGTAEERVTAMLGHLNQVFPNVRSTYLENSALRVHWPSMPFARGSYSCCRYGQWAIAELAGKPEGALYFCGEHCSVDFRASMEGAVETGALTAARLLDDLGVERPAALNELLAVKTAVPQPCYDHAPAAPLGVLTRRRRVLAAHAAFARALEPSA